MLMQMGPFRFTIPTYSVEALKRRAGGRVATQAVIGGAPPTHLLGPGDETMDLESTFFPRHLNGGGLAQLEGVRAASKVQIPMMFVSITGSVFGRWVITEVGDHQTYFTPAGVPEKVKVDMSILRYVGLGLGSRFGLF